MFITLPSNAASSNGEPLAKIPRPFAYLAASCRERKKAVKIVFAWSEEWEMNALARKRTCAVVHAWREEWEIKFYG